MRRKINLVGQNTLTISLPKQWVKLHNLEKGDELEVVEEGKYLFLSSEQRAKERTIDVDVSEYGCMAGKVVAALYKAGYDELRIQFDTPEQLQLIKEQRLKSFIGVDLVHVSQKFCILKSLASVKPEELDNSIRKVFRLLIENTTELYTALKNKKYDEMSLIADKDVNINTFADFSRRLLHKYGYRIPKLTSAIYYVVEDLENIGDDIGSLANYLNKYRPEISKKTLQLFERVLDFLKSLHELFYTLKEKDFKTLQETYKILIKDIEKQIRHTESKEGVILSTLRSMTLAIFDFNGAFLIKKYMN